MVHTSLDCSVPLPGKLQSGHGGNSCSERDLTVNLVNTGGGAKIWKCTAQNSKDKVTNYLNQPNFGKSQRFLTRKYCSITVGKFTMLKPMTTNVKSIHSYCN